MSGKRESSVRKASKPFVLVVNPSYEKVKPIMAKKSSKKKSPAKRKTATNPGLPAARRRRRRRSNPASASPLATRRRRSNRRNPSPMIFPALAGAALGLAGLYGLTYINLHTTSTRGSRLATVGGLAAASVAAAYGGSKVSPLWGSALGAGLGVAAAMSLYTEVMIEMASAPAKKESAPVGRPSGPAGLGSIQAQRIARSLPGPKLQGVSSVQDFVSMYNRI